MSIGFNTSFSLRSVSERYAMFLPPFDGPRLKIKRAQTITEEIRSILKDFNKQVKLKTVSQETDKPDLLLWTFRFSERPPDGIAPMIGDAVHNLRSALDIMICDIARHLGHTTENLYFPFAKDQQSFEARLNRREYDRLGDDVRKIITSAKPYKTGNVALYGLHQLDIHDKHELILPSYLVGHTTLRLPQQMTDGLQKLSGIDLAKAKMPVIEGRTTLHLRKDAQPGDMLKEVPGGPILVFSEGLPFAQKPVLETLENLAVLVDEAVTFFVGYFGRNNSETNSLPSGDD